MQIGMQSKVKEDILQACKAHIKWNIHSIQQDTTLSGLQRHNTIMDIIGPWIMSQSKEGASDIYYASLLVLLKPWHQLEDLRRHGQTWHDAFGELLRGNPDMQHMVPNIQYHYECREAVEKDE